MDYTPPVPALSLDAFPEQIRAHARRMHFCGNGSAAAPFISGWVVRSAGTDLSYNPEVRKWLKDRGFLHSGGSWLLRDDVGDANSWARQRDASRGGAGRA